MKMIPTQKTIESIRILLIALAITFMPNKGFSMNGTYIDMTLDSLITYLCEMETVQKENLEKIGFTFSQKKEDIFNFSEYGYMITCKDRTKIERVEIRRGYQDPSLFIVWEGISPQLTLDFFEAHFGKFLLLSSPRGESEFEKITYQQTIKNGILRIGLDQNTLEVLTISLESQKK